MFIKDEGQRHDGYKKKYQIKCYYLTLPTPSFETIFGSYRGLEREILLNNKNLYKSKIRTFTRVSTVNKVMFLDHIEVQDKNLEPDPNDSNLF